MSRPRPMTLDPDPRTRISAEIQLSKAVPLPGHPHSDPVHIDLTVHVPPFDPGDTADELTLTFSGERAVTLGRMLASAGRAARGDRP